MSQSLDLTITMDSSAVEESFAAMREALPRYINSWLVQSATFTKGEMSSRVNEGVGAAMGQGIKHNIDAEYDTENYTATVKPNRNVPYADALELGSAPHRPPADPDGSLAQWCELKGLSLYAIITTIARNGTQPHPFIEPTFEVVKEPIAGFFEDGVALFLDSMGVAI